MAFTRQRVAVFVDGCFWHSCPLHATTPQANREWWTAKLEANVSRDRDTDERLEQLGWVILRYWEHEDMNVAADTVSEVIRNRSA